MKEIERKFIVIGKEWKKLPIIKKISIRQGFLSKALKHVVRIRVTDTNALITIKGKRKGCTRDEFEYEIPLNDGLDLLAMCDLPLISKVRCKVRDQYGQLWEIDTFAGINDGLIIAEIELPSEECLVELPDWIGAEVTHDRRYNNTYLANHKV